MTPFGIAMRKIRLEKGLRIMDIAAKLGLTSSFISAVVSGKKPIPGSYVASVVRVLCLTQPAALNFKESADRSKTYIDVDALEGSQRELVAAFARKLDDLPPEFLEQIKKMVFYAA